VFYVYVLKSKNDYSQYIGLSQNLEERLEEHNTGRVNSTKSKRPWQLIYTESFTTCLEARKREKYLKSAAGRRFRKQIMGD
jgi:putative endonuclease